MAHTTITSSTIAQLYLTVYNVWTWLTKLTRDDQSFERQLQSVADRWFSMAGVSAAQSSILCIFVWFAGWQSVFLRPQNNTGHRDGRKKSNKTHTHVVLLLFGVGRPSFDIGLQQKPVAHTKAGVVNWLCRRRCDDECVHVCKCASVQQVCLWCAMTSHITSRTPNAGQTDREIEREWERAHRQPSCCPCAWTGDYTIIWRPTRARTEHTQC